MKWTPLTYAALNGFVEASRVLIEAGADVNLYPTSSFGPLHLAAQNRNDNIVKLLVQNKARVNSQNNIGYTGRKLGRFWTIFFFF